VRALILAAGKGSRLGAAAGGVPKPLVPVGGMPVLERSVRWVAEAGVVRIWINTHEGAGLIRRAIGDGSRFGVPVHYSHEPALLGTAGAWKRLEQEWTDTSLVVYGDNLMRFDLAAFTARHRSSGALATVALFDPARHTHTAAVGGRVRLDGAGRVVEFVEGGSAAAARPLVNAGAYLLEPAVAASLEARFLDFGHDVLPRLAAAGTLYGHVLEDGAYCMGIDTPDRLDVAGRIHAESQVIT
jgi:mannose-1-phosphate guanylyltransferase